MLVSINKKILQFFDALTAYKNKEQPPKIPALLFYLSSTTRHFAIYLDSKTRKENGDDNYTNLRQINTHNMCSGRKDKK